jgi:SNF2 family DNA or RNA helicase
MKFFIRHLNGTLKTLKYHGQKRRELFSSCEEFDIVLTTYHTLVSDFKERSGLHELEWFRVVLDEGMRTKYAEICWSVEMAKLLAPLADNPCRF